MDETNLDLPQDVENTSNNSSSEFTIPEEYLQKDWAKNFDGQTGDDLKSNIFKALDEKYSQQPQIPQTTEEYAFNDILKDENGNLKFEYPDDVLNYFGDEFKSLGLTKEQGQGILKKYTDFEMKEFQQYTNPDELEANINKMFNGNQQQRQTVESLIKEFLPMQDQQFLQQTAPNFTIEMFYKLANGFVNKYGYKENNSAALNQTNFRKTESDKDLEYNEIVKQIEELEKRPHSTQEKENLMSRLLKIYA